MKVSLYESRTVATYEKDGNITTEIFEKVSTRSPKKTELVNDASDKLESDGIDTIISIVPMGVTKELYIIPDTVVLENAVKVEVED